MEEITFEIEDIDGSITETKSREAAQEAYINGLVVVEVRTVTTYTEHTKIVLKA